MEKEEIKNNIIQYISVDNKKTITLSELYTKLQLPYTPAYDKKLCYVLNELIEEKQLQPVKTSKRGIQGNYEKYRIMPKQKEKQKDVKEEILNTLVKNINIGYFLKYPEEYIKNRETILIINEFIKNPDKDMLTVNERSYQLFQDEKKLKQNEELLKKLGLNYDSVYAYDTYEPFFCYINQKFQGNSKKIIIVENKDTFWTMKKVIKNLHQPSNIYMIIYGEGKKILKSLPYIEEFEIAENDTIQYFGDIDYEGINIYISLKEGYPKFHISVYKEGYETILDLEKNPKSIRTKQNIRKDCIQKFLTEFEEVYQERLSYIFNHQKYIPQEVFHYEVARKKVK